MRLAAGTRLGTYEVIAPLGAGGMGEVYRARDLRLGRAPLQAKWVPNPPPVALEQKDMTLVFRVFELIWEPPPL